MNVYLASHQPLRPGDPVKALTTVASPLPLAWDQLAQQVAKHNDSPVLDVRHRILHYPEMPPDPVVAIRQVEHQYFNCAGCHLSEERSRVVFFRGNHYAPVLVVSAGPGKADDLQGVPHAGRGGRLQDELFREVGLDPNAHIGWTTLIGCRPCDNRFVETRPPTEVEKVACSERLLMLLRAFRPRVVLCLGKEAAELFWTPEEIKKPHDSGLWPNTWHRLTPQDEPRDWVAVGYVRDPNKMVAAIANANAYKEYFGALLFYESLRTWMQGGMEKVAKWRFGLRYLDGVQGPLVGGRA